jgi:hypothetical protein
MMEGRELQRLREQGPMPESPPVTTIVRRAHAMRQRTRRTRAAAAVACLAVAVVVILPVEPWSHNSQSGVAGADVLAAISADAGCSGSARRATPAEADPVRFLPSYLPAGFTIEDAFSNHTTESPCFQFFHRAVYARRTDSESVAETLTISAGSEPADHVECGPNNAPKIANAPATDYQACIQVRGHTGAIVHLANMTSIAWIEPGVGAVEVHATELAPEMLRAFAQHLTTPGDGTIIAPPGSAPPHYALAFQSWKPHDELTHYTYFRATFVQHSRSATDPAPELVVDVSPSSRPLEELLPPEGFDFVDVQGHRGISFNDGGGREVRWKIGANLFSVRTPRGSTTEEALRVARSFAPVARDDTRLVDPTHHN